MRGFTIFDRILGATCVTDELRDDVRFLGDDCVRFSLFSAFVALYSCASGEIPPFLLFSANVNKTSSSSQSTSKTSSGVASRVAGAGIFGMVNLLLSLRRIKD